MMALRQEQPVEQVEQTAGNPAVEEKRQEASSSADSVMQDFEEAPVVMARKPPLGSTVEELDKHELTHFVFRTWCRQRLFQAGPGKMHIDALQHTKIGHRRSCWTGCSS